MGEHSVDDMIPLGEEGAKPQRKPMHFVSLHHHSTFSYVDGFRMPEAHMRRAADLNMQAMALTEHGNSSSHVRLEMAAEETGVKPIFGVELYTGAVDERRSQSKKHLTVLATDSQGYSNLTQIDSQAYRDFYYHPTASWESIREHNQGLIVLSGCTGSLLATSLIGGKDIAPEDAGYARGRKVARKFKEVFGDRYYLEVQAFPELENVRTLNKMLTALSDDLAIPLVASADIHYTKPSESEMQMILHNVRGGGKQTLEEMAQTWGYDVPLCPPVTDKVILKRLMATGISRTDAISAILATEEIANRCNVMLPKLPPLHFPLPPGYQTSAACFRAWLKQGWAFRGLDRFSAEQQRKAKKALKYEMKIIEDKDFVDYFLVVSDLVKFAKDSGIPVGPGRGSSAASLVCYLLRITEVNPLLFPQLIFERFIEPTRKDLPDIDLDFDSDQRYKIRNYAVAKYGARQVSNIGTFTFYKAKLALDDVARVHHIPGWKVDVVKNLLLERSSGDLRASATIEDTVEMFEAARDIVNEHPELRKAMDLEGNIKQFGVHAAGLVISAGPIQEICSVYERVVKDQIIDVIAWDKNDAERQNILKIDTLGLSTLTMIANALLNMNMDLQDMYDLPLDDEKVFDAFRANDVVGIFQFDGRAMRSVNAELQPDNFIEVCDVGALARPGPLHNNASAEYIDVKRGRKEPRRYHPLCDRITADTHYQIVYQEQIMRICGEIGGFDHTHRTTIRKIISHKHGEQEFNRWWEKFRDGAAERGVPEEAAQAIWGSCITAGTYAFNIAHSLSYGMLAYWTMWLKVYHPEHFYVASLNAYGDKKELELLRDADRHGITVLPPRPGKSGVGWRKYGRKKIMAGYSQISGIGDKTGAAILAYQVDHELKTWDELIAIRGIGAKTVAKIKDFVRTEDPFEIHKLQKTLDLVRKQLGRRGPLQFLPRQTHTSLQIPYNRGENVLVTWVGMLRHRNLRELFEVNFSRTGVALDPAEVKNPELNEWVIGVGVDEEELLTITWDRWSYPRFKEMIWETKLDHDVLVIEGIKKGFQSRRAIYVKRFWVIGMDEEEETDEVE